MSNDERVGRLVQAIENLAETSGQKEATKVIPNCRVVDADPADIPGYIIVENELGYYVPAIKSPDITYQDDDTVNLLIIKGTEPIAFQHGTGSGTGGYPGALPLTTKGDIVTRDTSDNIRLGVGDNNQVLTAVSSEPSGLDWITPPEPYLCQGRLSLTSGIAVTTSDVTGATAIYFTPFNGNRISIYNGAEWINYTFTELSLSLSGFTANKNNDVFIYDNAGTLTLERIEWTNDNVRATALTTQNGTIVKSGDTTRRYLGTFRTTSTTGQTEDSLLARYVWNYYNRVTKDASVANNTSHTYDSATVRAFNAGAMFTSGLAYIVGIVQEVITASLNGQITRLNTDSAAALGIGTVSTAHAISSLVGGNFNGAIRANLALLPITPVQGYNELWITESGGNTAGDPTFATGRLLVTLFC